MTTARQSSQNRSSPFSNPRVPELVSKILQVLRDCEFATFTQVARQAQAGQETVSRGLEALAHARATFPEAAIEIVPSNPNDTFLSARCGTMFTELHVEDE